MAMTLKEARKLLYQDHDPFQTLTIRRYHETVKITRSVA